MGRGLINFAGGLLNGAVNADRYDDALQHQQNMDLLAAQEAGDRHLQALYEQGQNARTLAAQQAMAEGAKIGTVGAGVQTVNADGTPTGNVAYQPDAGAATEAASVQNTDSEYPTKDLDYQSTPTEDSAPQQSSTPPTPTPYASAEDGTTSPPVSSRAPKTAVPVSTYNNLDGSQKVFSSVPTGLSGAASVQKYINGNSSIGDNGAAAAQQYAAANPVSGYARQMAISDKLNQLGLGDQADKVMERARNIRAAGIGDVIGALSMGNTDAAAQALQKAGFAMPPGGKFVITQQPDPYDPKLPPKTVYQLVDGQNKVVSPDVMKGLYSYIVSPTEQMKLENEMARWNAMYGSKTYAADKNLQGKEEGIAGKNGAGGAGAGKGALKTTDEQLTDLIKAYHDTNPTGLSPDQHGQVMIGAQSLVKQGLDPKTAFGTALSVVSNPKNAAVQFDKSGIGFVNVASSQMDPTVRIPISGHIDPAQVPENVRVEAAKHATSSLDQLNQQQPGLGTALAGMASGDPNSAEQVHQMLVNRFIAVRKASVAPGQFNEAQARSDAEAAYAQQMPEINRQAAVLHSIPGFSSSYFKANAAKPPVAPAAPRPVQQPQATANGDIQGSPAWKAAQRRDAAAAAAAQAKAKQAADFASAFNSDLKTMSPADFASKYDRLRSSMTPDQAATLEKQIKSATSN